VAAKTKTRTKVSAIEAPGPAPLASTETTEERALRIREIMSKPNPPRAVREEYRAMLKEKPDMALQLGTLPSMTRQMVLDRFKSFPAMEESIRFQLKTMRQDLAGDNASPLEVLLVEAVVLCYQDFFSFALLYAQQTKSEITLNAMEQWERILSSKEARYLRAIAELAKVRRLLNLPAPQLNINMPGGQQVNVSGKPS
jgi:hypothetical protein